MKANKAYKNMIANSFALPTSLTLVMVSRGHFYFYESSHVAYQMNRNEA